MHLDNVTTIQWVIRDPLTERSWTWQTSIAPLG
jgi:hypothetical protein